eukprot:gene11815-13305_t
MSGITLNLTPSDSQHTLIENGWFGEKEAMWPGQKFCIEVKEVLLNGRSQFQDILVFDSVSYGRVLVLDGVIQVTERDEFSYQEMITHLPLFACPNPRKVLIIGGGDGGVLREVVKHPGVQEIHMCEIDDQVIAVGKEYFRSTMSTAYDDPRLKLIIGDAAKYLLEEGVAQNYDVIICDSSDPVGPADVLFQPAFFQSMQAALNPVGGVVITQGECQWLHLDLIRKVMGEIKDMFAQIKYAYTTIPTYPSGQIGFLVLSRDGSVVLNQPSRAVAEGMNLRYYSEEIHGAAFVLPKFAKEKLYADRRGTVGDVPAVIQLILVNGSNGNRLVSRVRDDDDSGGPQSLWCAVLRPGSVWGPSPPASEVRLLGAAAMTYAMLFSHRNLVGLE